MRVPRSAAILGWHFISPAGRLDPHCREVADLGALVVVPGKTYAERRKPIACCENGLHSSVSALDALAHAPGPYVCRVASWGDVDRLPDKLAASRRRVLRMGDASSVLRQFAAWCALETPLTRGRKLRDLLPAESVRAVERIAEYAVDEPSADDHAYDCVSVEARARRGAAETELHALGARDDWSAAATAAYAATDVYAWRAAIAAADCARHAARAAVGPFMEYSMPFDPASKARAAAAAAAYEAQAAELTRLLFGVVGADE